MRGISFLDFNDGIENYENAKNTNENNVNVSCIICYGSDGNFNALNCGHIMCKTCYRIWFLDSETHKTCPMCNKGIDKKKTIDLFFS